MGSISAPIRTKAGDVLSPSAISELRESLKCEVIIKGEVDDKIYRAAIARWNQVFVSEAASVVFCEHENDVSTCLKWVKKWNMPVAIAGGRHSFHGASSTEGLVIDLRKMKKVKVDKANMKVSAEGGCKAVDVDEPAYGDGLAVVLGTVNDTGIGGLTLGGGSGYLTGQHGHVVDNLLACRVVLADGSIVTASEDTNEDLFWGLRGGGSNFGVVTEFTYRAHEQGEVMFTMLPFTPDKAAQVFQTASDLYATAITESKGKLVLYIAILNFPGIALPCPAVIIFYNGPEHEGRALAQPIYDIGPLQDTTAMVPYPKTTAPETSEAGKETHPRFTCSASMISAPVDIGILMNWFNDFTEFVLKYGEEVVKSKCVLEIRWHGVTSKSGDNTAYAGREIAYSLACEAQYKSADMDQIMREEVKTMTQRVRDSVAKLSSTQDSSEKALVNANYSNEKEKLGTVFGKNLKRLREVKRMYDPDLVFDKWYPIQPAEV